jgi:rubrerythrin
MSEDGKVLSTPAEILRVALRKEENAFRFYDNMLNTPKADFVRALIERLRDEEAKHVRLIQKEILKFNLGRG